MIECHDVIKIYNDPEEKIRVAALRGIDLRISKGEVISIVGPSGSGKSTLIKILAGMEAISSGICKVGSFELEKMNANELLAYQLNNVGLVHQFPERTLFLSGSVKDNLLFSSSLHSKNMHESKLKNKEILKELNIAHLENRLVANLSGGEMIRTAIAFMLAKDVPLLLCDEPTGQLDTANTENIKEILKQISRDFETTVLVVTHDKRFLTGVDRTCEIQNGRVSSLIQVGGKITTEIQSFPLKFSSHVDSSQNIRIPNEIYDVLQIGDNVDFVLSEDSKVEIINPSGIPPKKYIIRQEHRRTELKIKPLPEDYFLNKEISVQLKDLSKIYKANKLAVPAVTDINLKFYKGELVFIVGPSGSGKTTLVKLITGMEPSSNGEIHVLNTEVHNLTDSQKARFRRDNIGIVSQQGDLHPVLTVTENLFIKDVLKNRNITLVDSLQAKIDKIFSDLEISHRKEAFPLDISGGELQRASLAITEYDAAPILILDEPTANMDSELAEKVMKKIFLNHKKLTSTLIITTHDINLIQDYARAIELKDGQIAQDGISENNKSKKD
ncbi:MAG TPA: ATP-binding cassette domain-containing protein [candidate division Zixibacteria bacterium]|nr:ATP-binding cassette domain-containing protein [candidate division Zixibacteria bacterium]